eukprot:scaffold582_cov385-Prasinococcus_capsulatus_cf.AAC.17
MFTPNSAAQLSPAAAAAKGESLHKQAWVAGGAMMMTMGTARPRRQAGTAGRAVPIAHERAGREGERAGGRASQRHRSEGTSGACAGATAGRRRSLLN